MSLPSWLTAVLPDDTAAVWQQIAPLVPPTCYLVGGTAITVHIQHRESRDLDFFYHRASVDLDSLEETLAATGSFARTRRSPGTLNGLVSETRVQFLHADEGKPQRLLRQPNSVEGIQIAGMADLMATKLNAIAGRGEHRDYFDVLAIEEKTGMTVDEGINYFLARYQPEDADNAVSTIITALGYMDDIDEDENVPLSKDDVAAYWRRRQPEVLKSVGWLTSGGTPPPLEFGDVTFVGGDSLNGATSRS